MRFQTSYLAILLSSFHLTAAHEHVVMNPPQEAPFAQVGRPSLSDLLTMESSVSMFHAYSRESSITTNLLSSDSHQTTILAPTNRAVMALAKRPHHINFVDNVDGWVLSHVIAESPIDLVGEYQTLSEGKSFMFDPLLGGDPNEPAWKGALVNGEYMIVDMKEASNGVLYLIDGTDNVE